MYDDLRIEQVETSDEAIYIVWASERFGWGQYTIYTKNGLLTGDSEMMDTNDNKRFLRRLLMLLADQVEVLG